LVAALERDVFAPFGCMTMSSDAESLRSLRRMPSAASCQWPWASNRLSAAMAPAQISRTALVALAELLIISRGPDLANTQPELPQAASATA